MIDKKVLRVQVLEDLENLYGAIDGKSEKEFTYRTALSRVIKNVKTLIPPEGFPAPGTDYSLNALAAQSESARPHLKDVPDFGVPGDARRISQASNESVLLACLDSIGRQLDDQMAKLKGQRESLRVTRDLLAARVQS